MKIYYQHEPDHDMIVEHGSEKKILPFKRKDLDVHNPNVESKLIMFVATFHKEFPYLELTEESIYELLKWGYYEDEIRTSS